MEAVTKDILERKEEIKSDIRDIFEKNLKITDWNIPEADDIQAAHMLIEIFKEAVNDIEADVKNKKYDNY
jgi:hypothetical protein